MALFHDISFDLSHLVAFIDTGFVGLPDIQRPFIWPNTKVRDLFDSMYRGYPVGYLLLWENGFAQDSRAIGGNEKQAAPSLLIVDGQQRLTSLYAVLTGAAVVREDYRSERIEIAFDPLHERFEVADAAIRRDPAFVPNISVLWRKDTDVFDFVAGYLQTLEATSPLPAEDRRKIQASLNKLFNLPGFKLTALQLSSQIDEEQVAEVFVRINSKGTPLNQADFILTLMSVFWDEGRAQLEGFCRSAKTPALQASPFSHFLQPSPDQLLRVGVGVAFRRARLKFVYSILRGKDLETGDFSAARREEQFARLKEAQSRALALHHWHDYFKAVALAGYRGERMITSANNLLYTYVLYLLGRTEYKVEERELRRVIARWFFMVSLTGRYTKSPESDFEFDLARFRSVSNGREFVDALDSICTATLTSDYWTITLPNELATSAGRSPTLYAFYAAQVLLDARALFSPHRVAEMLDPWVRSSKTALERHHLFPKAHLERLGVTTKIEVNQIANYALAEWNENNDIGDQAPAEYLPGLLAGVAKGGVPQMYYWHALPDGWEALEYGDFLERRREMMSKVIADGFRTLDPCREVSVESRPVAELVAKGETDHIEFKSTLRRNLHTGQFDERMELGILKTIAGFLNGRGGELVVGVADDGTPVGIEADGFPSEDKLSLHLVNLINGKIGAAHSIYVHPRFEDFHGVRVLRVVCNEARSPVFVKEGGGERFYVRNGPATAELQPSAIQSFVKARFG